MEGWPPPADSGTERPYKSHKSITVFCKEKEKKGVLLIHGG